MKVEAKLQELALVLPAPIRLPLAATVPFSWVRVRGNRAYLSGHGPLDPDGSLAAPFGKVGHDVSEEGAYHAATLATLAMLASLKRALGDLDRVTAWLRVSGMVNAVPGFLHTTKVMNGCSDLLLKLYGPEAGQHARAAIGVAALPFNVPVVIEGEVEIA